MNNQWSIEQLYAHQAELLRCKRCGRCSPAFKKTQCGKNQSAGALRSDQLSFRVNGQAVQKRLGLYAKPGALTSEDKNHVCLFHRFKRRVRRHQ
ncbi:hypothetical protein D3C85_1681260 [compost metagenome]